MTVSIIIPTYNRVNTLAITLASVYNQSNLDQTEVIVIDNGSTDNTKSFCAEFAANNSPALKYVYDATPGLLTGRHLGSLIANGEVFCFLDDDVDLSAGWLEGVRDAFTDPEIQMATGPCLPKYETEPPEWISHFWLHYKDGGKSCSWLSLVDFGDNVKDIDPDYVWGLNFSIRKSALMELGGFHPDNIPSAYQAFQGDGESGLSMKAKENGYKALYHPGMKLHHLISRDRLNFDYFKKRAFYQGVCNSFTTLRAKHLNGVQIKTDKQPALKRLTGAAIFRLKNAKLQLNNLLSTPKSVRAMQSNLKQRQQEGFDFHQKNFLENQKVREWVVRKDYWDYKLPL